MSSSLRAHREELALVAGALSSARRLQDLLDMQSEWTAAMRREVNEQVAALTGYLLVDEKILEHTGDAEAVRATMEDIHAEALFGIAA